MGIQRLVTNKCRTPYFSVVIPCFNEGASLHELIARCEFAASQVDGEFILVNNGSTDDTEDILKKRLQNNQFVKYLSVPFNQGYGYGIAQGLLQAKAPIIGWTHADLQTDPADVLRAIHIFGDTRENIFVKGRRYGRPLADRFFTASMSTFETLLLGKRLNDINAQPTLFSRELLKSWGDPPRDFSLDLYAFVKAKQASFSIVRIPVLFAERKFGSSSWNVDINAKWKFIKRTLGYSFALRKKI